MTIYKVEAWIYDYYYDIDRHGWTKEEHFFTTEEKANNWIKEHENFCYGYDTNEAKNEKQKPSFKVVEIEVE